MAEPKTRPTKASPSAFIAAIAEPERRKDAKAVVRMMKEATGARPVMWGSNIIGFGSAPVTYANGKSMDWPVAAFSPRKPNLVLYLMPGYQADRELMARLGKHKTGKSCLYLPRLAEVHLPTLKTLIRRSVKAVADQAKGARG